MQTGDKRCNEFLTGYTGKNAVTKLLKILNETCRDPRSTTLYERKSLRHDSNPEHLAEIQEVTKQWNINALSQVLWHRYIGMPKQTNKITARDLQLHIKLSAETGLLPPILRTRHPHAIILWRGYLWDRLSSSRSDRRAAQRRWPQQTHHWSRKNWQHWLCTMHCQLKTTAGRGKKKTQTTNQQKGQLIRIQTVHQQLIAGGDIIYFKEDQTLNKSPKDHIQ